MKLDLLFGLILSLAGPADAELRITMRVMNDAQVPDWILAKAEKDAEYVAGNAGLEITLVHCPPRSMVDGPANPCHREFTPAEFWLRITPQRPPAPSEETLGFTIHEPEAGKGGGYAYVSYPVAVAVALANDVRASESQILGVAIAHEIGHLLLGSAHSRSGVMCGRWRRQHFELMSIGRLLFTPEETTRLQAEVARRITSSGERKK